jgi:hypothetical protein
MDERERLEKNQKATNKAFRRLLRRTFATKCGTIFGLFWMLRFGLFLWGLSEHAVMFVYLCSVCLVPTLLWNFVRSYRGAWAGELSFADGLKVGVEICFYAALLMAAVHFVYFRFIDHGYVAEAYADISNMLKQLPEATESGLTSSYDETIAVWTGMSPISVTLQLLSTNVFWGVLMSLPIALILRSNKPVNNI